MRCVEQSVALTWAAVLVFAAPAGAGEKQDATPPPLVHWLADFGAVKTAAQADEALKKAAAALLAAGGGLIMIPPEAPANWRPENITQGVWREPPPPAPAKRWGAGPGLTILDCRGGTAKVLVPQMSGLEINRTMRMAEGQSSPHWECHPAVHFTNSIVRGSTSFRDALVEDVEAGVDRRFYVRTIRGVFPGMFLNSGDYGKVARLYVKALGYDTEKNLPYFVADTDVPVRKDTYVHNKTHANVMRMDTYSHTENQTFDVMNWRHAYSQGDTYLYDAKFAYMSDVHSTGGDENGVLYAAFVESETNIFRGRVETWSPREGELKYAKASNAHTLGTGRPLINLNPQKWISAGKCFVLHPGGAILGWGESIRSADAPWTKEVIGRYFAVDEPDEYVPGGETVRRWWYITHFAEKDGVKAISIQRHWWGAKDGKGISRLYNPANLTTDAAKPKLLRYIIAPGANVYDVARGVKSGTQYSGGALERIVRLSPGPYLGTAVDFAADDPIEQAIGPDPFRPIPFRSWLFEKVPGAYPAPVFDIANHGPISRYAVMTVRGGDGSLKEREKRADRQPPWESVFRIEAACSTGLVFAGETEAAAIQFLQPNGVAQPVQWAYGEGKRAELSVSPQNGVLTYNGPGVAAPGGVRSVGGLSGTAEPASNLRGINVPVPAGSKTVTVKFPRPEKDEQYAVFVELSWLTNKAVAAQDAGGFSVEFATPPEQAGRLHWLLVR